MGIFEPSFKWRANRFARTMPNRVKNMISEHYDRNFELGGWQRDKTVRTWRPRKRNYKHPTLQKTGRLRSSQRVTYTNSHIIVEYKAPYAKYHNDPDGTHPPNIQRKFLGENKALVRDVKRFIIDEYKKMLK